MRALLINPWITDFSAYDLWSKPLGLLKIAHYLKELGFEIELIDCLDRFHPVLKRYLKKIPKSNIYGDGKYYSEEIEKPKIYRDIKRKYKRYGMPWELFRYLLKIQERPDVILLTSSLTYWYPGVFLAVEVLKERFLDVPLILGGIYATLCYEHAKEKSGADFVYQGGDIKEIIDLVLKLTQQNRYPPEINYDRISYSYDLYPNLKYLTLKTSGGCPFRCSWCGWYLLEDKIWQADPEKVLSFIAYFSKNFGIRNFSFYDDCLLYNSHSHILRIFKGIKEKNIKCYFHTPNGLNIKFITEEIARLLKETGFIQPRLGFDTSQKTKEKELKDCLNFLRQAGYPQKDIQVYILMGLPSQKIEEIRECVEIVSKFKVRIRLEEYSPVPGTEDFKRSGLSLDSDPLLYNNSIFPIYRDKYDEFQKIKDFVHKLNSNL